MSWYSRFIPDLVVNSFSELLIEQLQDLECKLILIDVDNTLVPHDQALPNGEVQQFVKNLQENNINVIIISNNTKQRVGVFAQALGVNFYASAKKPLPFTYKQIIKDTAMNKRHIICMGDQLMTDVWGAHNAGLRVIWSKPLVKRDIFYTNINRFFERIVYRKLVKEGYLNE